jgi:hypothetical protein
VVAAVGLSLWDMGWGKRINDDKDVFTDDTRIRRLGEHSLNVIGLENALLLLFRVVVGSEFCLVLCYLLSGGWLGIKPRRRRARPIRFGSDPVCNAMGNGVSSMFI